MIDVVGTGVDVLRLANNGNVKLTVCTIDQQRLIDTQQETINEQQQRIDQLEQLQARLTAVEERLADSTR